MVYLSLASGSARLRRSAEKTVSLSLTADRQLKGAGGAQRVWRSFEKRSSHETESIGELKWAREHFLKVVVRAFDTLDTTDGCSARGAFDSAGSRTWGEI